MKRNKDLRYYAFEEDFNSGKIVRINVLYNKAEEILDRVKRDKINTREEFKESLSSLLRYYYIYRAEHEVIVSSLIEGHGTPEKIDVWYQLEPNIDIITDYVIKELKLDF